MGCCLSMGTIKASQALRTKRRDLVGAIGPRFMFDDRSFDSIKNVTPDHRRVYRTMRKFWVWTTYEIKNINWRSVRRRYLFWQAILILIILYVLFKPKTDWYCYNRSRWNG